jgi:hypothetical protein
MIAVGWKITLPDELIQEIYAELGIEKEKFPIDNIVYSGILYATGCPGAHWQKSKSRSKEMEEWYKKQSKKGVIDLVIKNFYLIRAPRLIIAEGMMAQKFWVFLSNPSSVGTTQFKRKINAGNYQIVSEKGFHCQAEAYTYG